MVCLNKCNAVLSELIYQTKPKDVTRIHDRLEVMQPLMVQRIACIKLFEYEVYKFICSVLMKSL